MTKVERSTGGKEREMKKVKRERDRVILYFEEEIALFDHRTSLSLSLSFLFFIFYFKFAFSKSTSYNGETVGLVVIYR